MQSFILAIFYHPAKLYRILTGKSNSKIQHIFVFGITGASFDKNRYNVRKGKKSQAPEDVGGTGGFEVFLEIIADPKHEDYEHMTSWAKSQWWKPFDFKMAARRVKSDL